MGPSSAQNSWTYVPGLPDLSQSGKAAIDYFIKYAGCDENGNQTGPMKGGIVIFAAGNDGISDPVFPGAYEKVVAVASLGIDGRKVAGSNYGSWIDLAALGGHATGDERFRVFSTTTNGGYGYSAGTSMAAPQVSGIAALAVAAFGVQRPGFTSEKLREILVGSGRKQFTETINPEYAGMLGNGLVDAEYVLFYDTRPDPVDERTIAVSGYRTHAELSWRVPRCYLERPVSSFDVYIDTRTFSAATVDDIPATTVRHTFASDASLGETFACRIEGLEPRQIYCLAIVGRSPSGVPSRPAVISVRTGENTPPEATASIPNLFLQSDDKAGRSIDLQLYFADADAPGRSALLLCFAFRGKGRGVPRTGFGTARTALRCGPHDADRNGKRPRRRRGDFGIPGDRRRYGRCDGAFPQPMPRCTQRTHSGRRGRFSHPAPQCGGAAGARYAGFGPCRRQR